MDEPQELSLERNGFELVEHRTAVKNFFDAAGAEERVLPRGRGADQGSARAPRASWSSTTRCARATRPSARRSWSASRCFPRTTTTPNGPGRSACARSWATRPRRCSRAASPSSRCGAPINRCGRVDPRQSARARRRAQRRARGPAGRRAPLSAPRRTDLPPEVQPEPPLVLLSRACARDEAIVFKVYDSEKDGRARFTPHTSFDDPTTPPGAPPRQSIEARALSVLLVLRKKRASRRSGSRGRDRCD